MTWLILAWVALIVVWIAVGVNAAQCENESTELNQSACEAGTGIGVGLVILLGVLGFMVLSVIWFMTRPRRHCPACGRDAKKGQTTCRKCGFDFAAAAAPRPPTNWAPPPPPPPS